MTPLETWFEVPWLLPLAVLLPIVAAWALRRSYAGRRERLERLGDLSVVSRLLPATALVPPRWRMVRLGLAALLVGIAVAGPRWGASRSLVRSRGIDMVLALDASSSMLATDERPSRLERLKQEVRRLRALSTGDRIGVLAFAGRSYVLSPLTVDAGALDLFLDNLDPSVVGQAGSSLARTIRQGTDLLSLSQSGADKAIVIMTDGEAFEAAEEIVAEAKRAAEQGIAVVTVGFGTPQGGTIPVREGDVVTEKRDEAGQVVITRYDATTLQTAAQAAGGTFIPAEATDKAARVRQALARLRTQARATAATETRVPRFQWFLAPAVLLLLLDTFLSERRGRRRLAAAAQETAAAAAALLLVLGLSGCARNAETRRATEAYKAKRYAEAVAGFKRAIDGGDRSVNTLYNLGTALLATDSLDRAVEALDRATKATDAEVRYRALFNLGYAHLVRGLAAQGDSALPLLDGALAAYKQVLLTRPDDGDAKWNYELALHDREEKGGGGGGGGGGQSQSQGQSQEPQGESQQPSGGLGQRQAEQLLGSAAREERDVQAKKQQQNRVEPPPGGKDW